MSWCQLHPSVGSGDTTLQTPCTVRKRIKATGNVAKLTGVMKMVASAKARAAEEALLAGRPFGVSALVPLFPPAMTRPALPTRPPSPPAGVPHVQRVLL